MSKNIPLSLLLVALLSSANASQTVELDTITVTSATKTKQSIKDVTSNVNVITSEEIEEKHYTTVSEALSTVPGINFTSNGGLGQATSVFVRGFDSKRVLVLIDGVRYNDVTGFGAPFADLMIQDIQQIEVVKGAQSGVWGADATAGVINIITKKAAQGLHGFFNTQYGSFDTLKYGAGASYKTEGYYIKASSQKVDTNGFSSQASKDVDLDSYEKDGYRNTTSNIKFGFNINETNAIDISHTIINSHVEYDGFNAPNSYEASRTNDTFTNINFNHIDSFNELDIYMNKSKFDRDYSYGGEFDGDVYEYGIKSNIAYNNKDFVIVGIDYKSFEHRNSLDKEYNNKALFVTNSNELNGFFSGKTIITQSLRADRYNKFDNKTTGKIGIKNINDIAKDFTFSANYGTAYNVPTIYQLYQPGSIWGPVGNVNLTPEDTTSYDIGAEYKDIKLTYFSSTIEDMIDYTSGYVNLIGESKIQGIEVEYDTSINDDILISSNYTYLDAKNQNAQALRRRPNHTLNLNIDYYGIQDLHLGAYAQYIGERYENDDQQGVENGKYTVVNMVANYEINKNILAYVKIDNLFNEHYQVVDGYASAPLSAYTGLKINF